jgi:enterochelin esterase-like enzyme
VGLTSPALVALLAVVAAALLAGTLWWWPRLARRSAAAVALRAALLCALELSVLALIFVIVNRSNEFYSSWSDLFGTDSGSAPVVAVHYRASAVAAPVTVTGSRSVPVPGMPGVPPGRLQSVRFHGALSGVTVPGYVYLPARSLRGGPSGRARLAVIVVISNQLGSPGPFAAEQLAATAERQIAAGRLRPALLVMLPATFGAADLGCLNLPGGVQAATFFGQDLPQAIQSKYRTSASRRWGLLGDASGGYCALQLAMTSSQTYAAAALPPGGYTAPPGASPLVYGGSPQIAQQDNLAWLLQHQPMQPISVLFVGPGKAQPYLSLASAPMQATAVGQPTGQWQLAPVLDWLGHALAAASAAGRG